jgi:transporter family protein
MLPWYVFTVLSALFVALAHITKKKVLYNEHALEFSAMRSLIIAVLSLFLLPFVNFHLTIELVVIFFAIGLLGSVAAIYLAKSMRHMEISTVSPLTNLSPVFLLFLTYFFLGEKINLQQFGGIALIMLGGYVLNIEHKLASFKHLVQPITKLFKSKYYHYILFSLIIYSVTAFLDKIAIDKMASLNFGRSGIYTATFFIWLFTAVCLLVILYWKYDFVGGLWHGIKVGGVWTIFSGVFSVASSLLYFQAISLSFVSLVIPVKRISTLISTFIGGELFHDHNLLLKSLACIIMVVGATLVAI